MNTEYKVENGEWVALPEEPCRFCREPGGVFFALNEGMAGHDGSQEVRCDRCKRTWMANESAA